MTCDPQYTEHIIDGMSPSSSQISPPMVDEEEGMLNDPHADAGILLLSCGMSNF